MGDPARDVETSTHLMEAKDEVVFRRSVQVQADGSFDFGRLPCSNAAFLEVRDSRHRLHRLPVLESGSLQALIDLR